MTDTPERCHHCKQFFQSDELLHTPDDPEYAFPGAVLCTICQLHALAAGMGSADTAARFRVGLLAPPP